MASYAQLNNYSTTLNADNEGGRYCAKVVLSFEDCSDCVHPDWTSIYYKDFATQFYKLLKERRADNVNVFFALGYTRLLYSLSTVIEYGESYDLKEIDSELQKELYSLFAKRRYSRYYRTLTNRLRYKDFANKICYNRNVFDKSPKTKFYVNFQYATFTGGMIEAVIDLTDDIRFIIQLQDKGEAIGFVIKNVKMKTKRDSEKTEQQRILFYDTIKNIKNDYYGLVEKLFEHRADFDCKGKPTENHKIHGYNNMVYYLEDKVKISENSNNAITIFIQEIETVLQIVNPETL